MTKDEKKVSETLNLILMLSYIIKYLSGTIKNLVRHNTAQMLSRLPDLMLNAGIKANKGQAEAMKRDAPSVAKVLNYSIEAYKLGVFDEFMELFEYVLDENSTKYELAVEIKTKVYRQSNKRKTIHYGSTRTQCGCYFEPEEMKKRTSLAISEVSCKNCLRKLKAKGV